MNLPPQPEARATFPQTNRSQILLIVFCWALVNAFLYWKNGIVTTGEAEKYIDQAHIFVATGHLSSPNFWFYSVPISLLSFCLKFHLDFGWLFAFQLLLNLSATLVFFKTILRYLSSPLIPFIGTLLLLLDLPYQSFNSFLQTESLFQSISLMLSCYLITRPTFTARSLTVLLAGLILLSMTRPNGLLYWPAVLAYLFFYTLRNVQPIRKWAFALIAVLLSLFLLNAAMGSGGELDFMLPFREEHIICGTPTLLYPAAIHTTGNGNSLYALLYYVTNNFGQFIRLASLKSISFWGVYRHYYSFLHNLFLVIYFYSINIAALISVRWWRRQFPPALFYCLLPILLTWLTVIFTCDDWHNRIFLGISPYILFISLPILRRRKG